MRIISSLVCMLLLIMGVVKTDNLYAMPITGVQDGCMDMSACNYNPAALIDDGSCCFSNCGCTDNEAVNYSVENICDDNSCMYLSDCSLLETDVEEYQSVCRGGLLEIIAENEFADEISWVLDGEVIGNQPVLNYVPEIGGESIIHLICSNDFCVDSTEILLDVYVLDSPELSHTGLQFCEGETTVLSAESENQNVWIFGSQFYSLADSVTISNGGLYSVVSVDDDCISNSVAVVVTVSSIPVAEIVSSSTDICEGDYVQLQSVNQGQYIWLLNGETYSTLQQTQTSLEGEFTLQVVNNTCYSNIDSIILTERENPDTPEIEFINGGLVASEIADVEYVWYVNGSEVAVTQENYYTPTISGNYRTEARTEFGCTSSSEFLMVTDIREVQKIPVSIYPNPMETFATLDLGNNKIISAEVLDLQGRVLSVLTDLEINSKIVIERSDMASGFYSIRLFKQDNTVELIKLMVK